jgi:hypothetical protein
LKRRTVAECPDDHAAKQLAADLKGSILSDLADTLSDSAGDVNRFFVYFM